MEESFTISELFQILWKKVIWIIAGGIIALSIAVGHSIFLVTPLYRSTSELIVNTGGDRNYITNHDIQTSINLMNTYRDIITRPIILDEASNKIPYDYTGLDLRGMTSVNTIGSSQILSISVTHPDPLVAQTIGQTITDVFDENIGEIMGLSNNVTILTPSTEPLRPINGNLPRNATVGLVGGVAIATFIVLLIHFLDATIKSEADVKQIMEANVLGTIPTMTANDFTEGGKYV